ncbi:MAG: IS110 family RNA-guided transposase [Methylobacter sp.]
MFQIVVGVDIAKHKFDVARLETHKYKHKKFDNTPDGFAAFIAWLATFGDNPILICMEATGAYSIPLAEFLVQSDYPVAVVNPAKIKGFAKSELSRVKTDKADAKLIARYALEKQPSLWTLPPANIRELHALLRRVEDLLEMRQMEKNRLDTANASIAESIKTVLTQLEKELKATRKRIQDLIDQDPDLKRRRDLLETIPGIAEASSAHLLVALSEHYRFTNAKQAVAFAGLNPALNESGTWKGRTRISKMGDPLLRAKLYMPAVVAGQHNPVIRAFRLRLEANRKNGMAIVCASMRKLVHIAFAILKSGKPFDPHFSLA